MVKAIRQSYQGFWKSFQRYWGAYGGIRALTLSPYLHASIVLTALMYPAWLVPGWWDTVISVVPGIIGFSLGGYAIWLALGDSEFRSTISGEGEDGTPSPYMAVNSAFVHFILVQILALVVALVFQAQLNSAQYMTQTAKALSSVGYGLFIYSVLCAVAATFAVLRVASWFDIHQTNKRKKENADKAKPPNGGPADL